MPLHDPGVPHTQEFALLSMGRRESIALIQQHLDLLGDLAGKRRYSRRYRKAPARRRRQTRRMPARRVTSDAAFSMSRSYQEAGTNMMSAVINPGEAVLRWAADHHDWFHSPVHPPPTWLRPMTKANLCANVRPHMRLGTKSGSKSTSLVVVFWKWRRIVLRLQRW